MASQKNIAELYKEQEKSFLDHLRSARQLDPEEIHQLRVSTKKIRSLLRFLENLTHKKFNKKRLFDLFAPVYKNAGEIRTNFINTHLLSSYHSKGVSQFKERLYKQSHKKEKELKKEIGKFDDKRYHKYQKEAIRVFAGLNKKTIRKYSDDFVKKIVSDLHSRLNDLYEDETVHYFRKKMKDIKSISTLLFKLNGEKDLKTRLEKIKLTEEMIGNWHDQAILVETLEKYILKQKNEDKGLTLLTLDLKLQNELNKREIAKQLHTKLF